MSTAAAHEPFDVSLIDFQAEQLRDAAELTRAVEAYREHGCLVVRGLMSGHVARMAADVLGVIDQTIELIDQAKPVTEGWSTPNGSLLLPAPEGFPRDKQIMCLPINYRNSAEFFRSALNETVLDLAEAVLGPDIELFGEGQSLVKEAVGGHPKHLHQDAAYFEHKYDGPLAVLSYVVDTDLNNGCLHTVPGSHKMGVLQHEDTFSHLGLNGDEWPWERATPIEGKAGDSIVFHVNCIHGSKPNWSDAPRPVFIHRYRAAQDYVVVSATTTEKRAAAETKKEAARKENQLGLMVRGARKWDAARFA